MDLALSVVAIFISAMVRESAWEYFTSGHSSNPPSWENPDQHCFCTVFFVKNKILLKINILKTRFWACHRLFNRQQGKFCCSMSYSTYISCF